MFTKILIANRGEIACRVITTAARMGIQTVAVYSDADRNARHVSMADEAFRLGPSAARDSYLRADLILAIAKQTGAQAIHPGYGFLSENETFAGDCANAGIAFIGPPASAIAAMGSKSAAKTLMAKANIPLVAGYHGDNQDAVFLETQAIAMGFPVLIKASAGGGGKGMRMVESASEFASALTSCRREAKASFGDDKVLVEQYLKRPRHIEVQVFADAHGNCLSLFERDCSVQRRHQKVIEEAPAPGMTIERRSAMGKAAVDAAKAVGYVGAGTVEFIADESGQFYFMEMNTRLQVEHPVTEMINGLDLVEWQLRVAAGEALPVEQADLQINGHSIEARIYAENPEKGFLPATGSIKHLASPDAMQFTTGQTPHLSGGIRSGSPAPVRIDSGMVAGGEITPFYDPMIAKLIVWGPDRGQAIARMLVALQQFEVAPVVTNVRFLQALMRCQSFVSGDLDTSLIERESSFLLPSTVTQPKAADIAPRLIAIATAARLASEAQDAGAQSSSDSPNKNNDPWASQSGWRIQHAIARTIEWQAYGDTIRVETHYAPRGFTLKIGDHNDLICLSDLRLQRINANHLSITASLGSEAIHQSVLLKHDDQRQLSSVTVFDQGVAQVFKAIPTLHWVNDSEEKSGSVIAPMPGKVISILVQAGQAVKRGQAVLTMEAMKMEHTMTAPADGIVDDLLYRVGDQVAEGVALVKFKNAAA